MTGKQDRPKLIEPKNVLLTGDGYVLVIVGYGQGATSHSTPREVLLQLIPLKRHGCGTPCEECWAGTYEMFRAIVIRAECGSYEATKAGAEELVKNLQVRIK